MLLKQKLKEKNKLFLPVIHCKSRKTIKESVEVAYNSGADGVIFIDQGDVAPDEIINEVVPETVEKYSNLFIGLNILGDPYKALKAQPDIIWTDNCGISLTKDDSPILPSSEYRGKSLWFGGVAFKYQFPITSSDDWEAIAEKTKSYMEVVVTSGVGTGYAVDPHKAKAFRKGLGDHPLGIASGIAIENVEEILPYVDVYIVASSIEKQFGVLDASRTNKLSNMIHSYRHGKK